MKKSIIINDDDAQFMADYKKSHAVIPSKFIDMAIREKIVRTKQELLLQEHPVLNKEEGQEFLHQTASAPITKKVLKMVLNRNNQINDNAISN